MADNHADLGFTPDPSAYQHSDLGFVAAPPEPGPLQRFGSAVLGAVNPIPAIKEYINRPQANADVMHAAHVALQSQGRQMTPEESAAVDKGVNAPVNNPMNAVPVMTEPLAAAGGQAQQGNLAGAAGTLVGGYGIPAVAPALIRGAGRAAAESTLPARLEESAATQYGRVLNPATKANKYLAARVTPELIDRGVAAVTLKGLQSKAGAQIARVGQAIGDAWDNLPPGSSVDAETVLNRIQQQADDLHTIDVGGRRVPFGPEAQRALGNVSALKDTLYQVAEAGPDGKLVIPTDRLRMVRQYLDNVAAKAGRYQGKDLADASTAEAHGMVADIARDELAKEHPDIAVLNKEYSFWKNVNQVVSETIDRRTGQAKPLGQKLATAAGAGAGFAAGGVHGAILGRTAMTALEKVTTSPAWGTVSAVMKDRLAKAIADGNRMEAEFAVAKIARAAGVTAMADQAPRNGSAELVPAQP